MWSISNCLSLPSYTLSQVGPWSSQRPVRTCQGKPKEHVSRIMFLPWDVPGALRCLKAIYRVWENNHLWNVAQILAILQSSLPTWEILMWEQHNRSIMGTYWPLEAASTWVPCPCRGDTRDAGSVSIQSGKNPGLSVHISQLFIGIEEEPSGGRRAHCPSLPRPSAAWVTAFVTVLVTVSVTSFTTLSPVSWAFFKASARAVRKKAE